MPAHSGLFCRLIFSSVTDALSFWYNVFAPALTRA
jgi:hypothetical protein